MRLTILFTAFFTFLFSGCFTEKIEITSVYIINSNWNKRAENINSNSIQIVKLKVKKDSTINHLSVLNQVELFNKLEEDTTFNWAANVKVKKGENYNNKKFFFNKDNGFDWWSKDGVRKTKIIGKLEKNSWYEITRLSYYYFILYIDTAEKVHRYAITQANY